MERVANAGFGSFGKGAPLVSSQPHCRARPQAIVFDVDGLQSKAETVEVMVADGPCCPPGGKLAEWPQFGDTCGDTPAVIRRERRLATDGQSAPLHEAGVAAEDPLLAQALQPVLLLRDRSTPVP